MGTGSRFRQELHIAFVLAHYFASIDREQDKAPPVPYRLNMAVFICINGLNANPTQFLFLKYAAQDHLDFKFKTMIVA